MSLADLLDDAEAALDRGDHDEAIRIYEDLRTAHPDDPRVLLGLGRALTSGERYAAAETLYDDMDRRRIAPIRAHLGHARVLLKKGELPPAQRMYRNVIQADNGNLEARIGLAEIKHRLGLNRTAREQADNIVLDHPESREARILQQSIRESLRPFVTLEPSRTSDSDGQRVDGGTAAVTFMAEPQTAIRIGYSGHAAEFRCTDPARCADVSGPAPVNRVVYAEAQALTASLAARLIQPLSFEARVGAVREESFDGDARIVVVGGGDVGWEVGPRFSLRASGGREALVDTAPLIDGGIRLDTLDLGLEYRFGDDWVLGGHSEYGSYSDGNARQTINASLEWRLPRQHPRVEAMVEARYRTFHDDRDNGYFDPLRYDAQQFTVRVRDESRGGWVFWSLEGGLGRQNFDHEQGSRLEAETDSTIRVVRAAAGVAFGKRARLEVFYSRDNDALQSATGFTTTRAGFALRIRG